MQGTINTPDDLERALADLLNFDPRLRPVAEIAGPLPLRRSPPGLASLVSIIVSQQVSKASADAIFRRLEALGELDDPLSLLGVCPEKLQSAGLSRPKLKTIFAVAEICANGHLDLQNLCLLPAHDAIASLTGIPGIGPWTAEVFLLFCAGHPDIFPAGDIALQNAWQMIIGAQSRPTAKELAALAQDWSPWRGTAARLLWAFYGVQKGLQNKSPV